MERRDFILSSAAAGLGVIGAGLVRNPETLAQERIIQSGKRVIGTIREGGEKLVDGVSEFFEDIPLPECITDLHKEGIFVQPKLPYELGGLAPFLSEEQMSFHYGKHHAAYFKNLSNLIAGTEDAKKSLTDLIKTAPSGGILNNAAQAFNHTFFWNCMAPKGGGGPGEKLGQAITRTFGGFAEFKEAFSKAAAGVFGSGWTWLASDKAGELSIKAISNEGCPIREGLKPLLTIDVWEHAYYLDYKNERAKFIAGFFEKINWPFAEACYG